jgi:hypothetical protein
MRKHLSMKDAGNAGFFNRYRVKAIRWHRNDAIAMKPSATALLLFGPRLRQSVESNSLPRALFVKALPISALAIVAVLGFPVHGGHAQTFAGPVSNSDFIGKMVEYSYGGFIKFHADGRFESGVNGKTEERGRWTRNLSGQLCEARRGNDYAVCHSFSRQSGVLVGEQILWTRLYVRASIRRVTPLGGR